MRKKIRHFWLLAARKSDFLLRLVWKKRLKTCNTAFLRAIPSQILRVLLIIFGKMTPLSCSKIYYSQQDESMTVNFLVYFKVMNDIFDV